MSDPSTDYSVFTDLAQEVEPPANGILSRTLLSHEGLKVVAFGFAPGEELSEHTAARPAVLHILRGEATLTLGADRVEAAAGTWVHMRAKLPHSVRAKSALVMLLLLLPGP